MRVAVNSATERSEGLNAVLKCMFKRGEIFLLLFAALLVADQTLHPRGAEGCSKQSLCFLSVEPTCLQSVTPSAGGKKLSLSWKSWAWFSLEIVLLQRLAWKPLSMSL